MPRRRPKAVIVDLRTAEGNDLSGVRRPSASRRATGSTLSSEEARVSQEVHDMFTGIVDDAVITNVLQQTQYDAERAVEVLFDLSSRRPPSSSTAPAAAPSAEPACTIADDEAGECWWAMLPTDVQLQVWEHLSLRDTARAAGSCREFAQRMRHARSTLPAIKLPPGLSPAAVSGMVRAFGSAHKLRISAGCALASLAFWDAVAAGSRGRREGGCAVTALDLGGCRSLTADSLVYAFDAIGTLRELHLANCTGLDDDVLVRLTSSMRRMRLDDEDAQMLGGMSLEEAQHGGAHGAGWDGGSPGDGALAGYPVQHPEPGRANTARSFIEDGVAAAADAHRPLPEWQLLQPQPAGRSSVRGLRALSVAGCQLSGLGLQELCRACTKTLEQLDVSRTGVSQLPSALSKGVLHSFTANQCSKLTAVVLRLPKAAPLRHLSLSGCSALRRLDLAAERLQGLNVSGCGALEELGIACPALESLAMAQCARLEALPGPPRCPVLRTANLAGCSALEDLDAVLAGWPALRALSVNGCIGLHRLSLAGQPNLERLEASGCKRLAALACASPLLQTLLAQACPRLQEVRLQARRLVCLDVGGCGALRTLQVSGLERAMAELQAEARASKVPLRLNVDGCPELPAETLSRLGAAFSARKGRR